MSVEGSIPPGKMIKISFKTTFTAKAQWRDVLLVLKEDIKEMFKA